MTMDAPSKENFRLLDLSSDDDSEDLQLEIQPKRKKIARRDRNRINRVPESINTEIQIAVKWALRATLFLWLLVLTWTTTAFYEQMSSMQMDVLKVSTSSNGVGDALQLCHTAAKELRANATELSSRLSKLETEHSDLSLRVEQAVTQLSAISEQLAAAPKLADTPRRLAELQRTVGSFGAQINDIDAGLKSTRKQVVAASAGLDEVRAHAADAEQRANATRAAAAADAERDRALAARLDRLNGTLGAQLAQILARINEAKVSTTPVPSSPAPTMVVTSQPTVISTTPSTTTTTTTTIPTTTGPPNKPSVLQP